MPEIVLLVI